MLGMPMDAFFELYEKNNKYYSVLLRDGGDPGFASKLKNSIKPIIMQEFTNEPDVDQKELGYILEYTLSAMIGIMSYWFRQTDKLPNVKLHEFIHKLMEQGIMKQLP